MNDDDDTQNKSVYGSSPRFHDNPILEYENFTTICGTNFDGMEEKLQSITIDENVWDDTIKYNEVSDKITEEIRTYFVETAVTDGENEYYKRKIRTRNEELTDISQLIQECVVTMKELENEKSEMTSNLINKHKAVKQANKYYIKRLNFHISVEIKNGIDYVKICLLTQDKNDQYSFIVSINEVDKIMKLESTKPKINETQFTQIQKTFQDEQNLCALVCEMRKLFLSLKNN